MLLSASEEALDDSSYHPTDLASLFRSGVYIGQMNSNLSRMNENISGAVNKGFNNLNRLTMLHTLTNMGTANLSVKYRFKGPTGTSSTACATGASAIGEAFRLIQLDEADVMLAGGSDECVNPITIYAAMK